MTSDLFKKDFGPIAPTYQFAVGATKNELEQYWKGQSDKEKEEKEKEEREKAEKEEKTTKTSITGDSNSSTIQTTSSR